MKNIIKEFIKLFEIKIEQIKNDNQNELSQYKEGKIDGLNIAIRELERYLKF